MPIHVALSHRTRYRYDRPVTLSPQVIRLRPAPHCRTPILSYSLVVAPKPHFINWHQDPHGNYLARVVFPDKARELTIDIDLTAELSVFNPFDFFLEPSAETFPFAYERSLDQELAPYLERLPAGPRLRDYLATIDRRPVRTIDFLVGINRRLAQDIAYIIRLEAGVQTPEETLVSGRGSCRDSAWLLVQILRHLGLAARFVSGYLIQLTADVKPLDGPAGAAIDFTDLHAWAEVYVPGAGWIGLDPTSGLLAGEGHIPLAATPGHAGAAPVTGATGECTVEFAYDMQVRRIHESPRVTKPYTEEQWQAIDACGQEVDRALLDADVRLTMGGEPTFVSIDDPDGAEWNTDALGPRKRRLADALTRRLKGHFAPGGLLHHGQGKWYPGESLPRWTFGCWWRRDGVAIWKDEALFADADVDYGHGEAEAKRFVATLADRLGVGADRAIPAYEDVWHYLWRERRLPVNVDPLESDLKNKEDRERLARIFEQGLDRIVGYVLPLHRIRQAGTAARWTSATWTLRSGHLFLIPGDSPIGYRLPLDSLPRLAPDDEIHFYEADLFADAPPLPAPQMRLAGAPGVPQAAVAAAPPLADGPAAGTVRTALCVEPRHGRLHVFIPPTGSAEDYLDLIAAIESTAAAVKMPIVIEGTPPSSDPRLENIRVTPDPGVIEVNMHPAQGWDELVRQTTVLYDEARQSGLGTEKFMLDGRHTGTGGGNHIVLGGPTPGDSPILRRPDLLRSLVGYWHNHPSMSYLFSGLFLGPTSQHPRVDEARNDSIHELEIAFARMGDRSPAPPWLVDRVFRNLLIDVTGNTHRAEFCIDKLYNPDSSSGRQGLVELRAFEMPPHGRMSLTQQLLLRALVARFWIEPFTQPLVRWGTDLHDRFMLPHFVAQDIDEVVADLRRQGHALETAWFAPHLEFRFPLCGTVTRRGVHLEVRQALEPWHVMGEETGGGGTVRYVDSSVERVQVKATGLTGSRHLVTCNGRRLPLHPTGTPGEFVAGVRYRAWQPPSGLHPTIPVQAPLVFDILDTWNERSMGGCVYHVTHPGGRSFETFPVNAYEAESRRLARFFDIGHTAGPVITPPEERARDFPMTLDLRTAQSS